jgi:hypothetical protein
MASTSWHSLLITVGEVDEEHHDETSKSALGRQYEFRNAHRGKALTTGLGSEPGE